MTFHRISLAAGLLLALLSGAVSAQYKIVGPDGRITYTDRPVAADAGGRVQSIGPGASSPTATGAALPAELQPLVARFPVTLYTSSDCPPCDSGRKLLQARGVPYTERVASSDDDIAALLRLTGGRTVPALTVGSQALRGYLEADWQSTLDLAGYPKESRLPRGWQASAPAPLVTRAPARSDAPAPRAAEPAPVPAELPASGIRF